MMDRVRYDRIGTLEELRSERYRIDLELHRMKCRLEEDRKEVADLFTPAGVFTYLGGGIDRICTTVQWCLSGYDFVRNLIIRIRDERQQKKKDED